MQKTIFITGASSGLGKVTAKLFQQHGWHVIATMRSPEKETELNLLENVTLLPLDVTNTKQIKDTVTEDALAYLTDAGLVGRNIMSAQGRWPTAGSQAELEHKLGENIWWLIVLAERSGIDIGEAVTKFLAKTEGLLGE